MFVSGFTIARNVLKADYPIKEAILSILPLCDEIIVAVGKSDDDTLGFIKSLAIDKIKIIETIWDDSLREGGKVLAEETNKAFKAINPNADWCIYIQADECLHEKDYSVIKSTMMEFKDISQVDGLLFKYLHFYGSYDYIADSRSWYRQEVRIIKNNPQIYSYKDAQGFRKNSNEKLNVKFIEAHVHHYGWVKHPTLQLEKLKQARKLWHSDEFIDKTYQNQHSFDFSQVDSLKKFEGTHPEVIQERIQKMNWTFEYDITHKNMSLKNKLLYFVEKLTCWRIGEHRNFRILK
jgi:glycosyltransferase involved in cell wall biosynthesis